jgi:hypothetical protein
MIYLSAMTARELSDLIAVTGIPLAELHRRTGVSLNTLRSLSSGRNRRPQRRTRLKLAAFLRQHSETLVSLADQLEQG